MNLQGRLYMKSNDDFIQITTSSKIYFYALSDNSGIPELSNVMSNFMDCSIMMYGIRGKYCITYKTNEKAFVIYRRKYNHDFRQTVVRENFESSLCLNMKMDNTIVIS